MLNSPRYISGFETLTPCRSLQGFVTIRSQSFSRFRVIITFYEIINEPRLKTEPYVTYFLFFLSSKSTLKKVCYEMVILQSINVGFRTAILGFTWFYCSMKCFIWNKKLSFVKWFHVFMLLAFMYFLFFCVTGGR